VSGSRGVVEPLGKLVRQPKEGHDRARDEYDDPEEDEWKDFLTQRIAHRRVSSHDLFKNPLTLSHAITIGRYSVSSS
jgi:hypothetical protein